MNSYLAGSLVTVNVQFVDQVTKENADPTSITLSVSVNEAASSVTTYTGGSSSGPNPITNNGVGLYSAELDTTDLPGNWWYQWDGTGDVQAISAAGFVVVPDPA